MEGRRRLWEEAGTKEIVREGRKNCKNMKQRKKNFENGKWKRTTDNGQGQKHYSIKLKKRRDQ